MSPWTGSAPSARTFSAERSERARARTSQPSLFSRWIRRPPMKPEPPVTKALSATWRTLPSRLHLEAGGLRRRVADRRQLQHVRARRELARLEAQLVGARLAGAGEGGLHLALAQHRELHLRLARQLVADDRALRGGERARLELERRELHLRRGRQRCRDRRGLGLGSRLRRGRRRRVDRLVR